MIAAASGGGMSAQCRSMGSGGVSWARAAEPVVPRGQGAAWAAEGRTAVDGAANGLPGLLKALEFAEGIR